MQKFKIRKMLALGCACAMLLSATAFAAPEDEDVTVSPDSAVTVNVDETTPDGTEDTATTTTTDSTMVDPPIDDTDPTPGPYVNADVELTASVSDISTGMQVVATKNAKLYVGAGTSTGDAGTMTKGTVRTVLSISGNFCKVKIDGTNVWVHAKNVEDVATATIKITATATANVYSEASTSSTVLTTIPSGTTRTVLNYSGNFYKIKMNSQLGWVKMNTGNFDISITTNTTTDSVYADIAALAKKQVGKDYVWGATGPNTFDCSGLAKYCYNQNGITSLPRVSYEQYNESIKVSKSKLQPGYLVFFNCNNSSNGVDHVGIYIGNGEFVHAANSNDGVKISDLSESYYSTRYVGGGYYK